ncbi:MAG TPA: hypothetical protein VEY09_13115 [Pyrinomonadaceae bacterium]|nr:hypothetical protein [Pyrinomonadaceae bacterium]
MAVELRIVWDGDVPGIAEHRLSIAAFGEAINLLLAAYRRIASNMFSAAEEYAVTGRLHNLAKLVDVEIAAIEGSSTGIVAYGTFRPTFQPQASFFVNDIAERAAAELVESIQQEGNGQPRNADVRKFLAALPEGLTRQRYELTDDNGQTLHAPVELGHLNLPAPSLVDLPYLFEFTGNVIGVGFEPGKSEVRIRTVSTESLQLSATTALVERALSLRNDLVRGMAVRRKEARLLRLDARNAEPFALTPEVARRHVFTRWDELLTRLAQ